MNAAHSHQIAAGDERITTIVADDSPSFLYGFRHFLRTEPGTCLVGTASDAFEAIELVRRLRPRLVVMDLHMPGLHGDQAAVWIAEHFPDTHVLLVSSDQHPEVAPLSCQGACAFMCKNDLLFDFEELLERWFPRPARLSAGSAATEADAAFRTEMG